MSKAQAARAPLFSARAQRKTRVCVDFLSWLFFKKANVGGARFDAAPRAMAPSRALQSQGQSAPAQ